MLGAVWMANSEVSVYGNWSRSFAPPSPRALENLEPERSEQFEFEKRFHVSPFNGMHQDYRWTFSFRGPQLRVHMSVMEENTRQFDATLVVQRKPLNRRTLHDSLRRFPLEALKVSAGIYWHALKLKLKGVPFYTHPNKLEPNDPAFRLGQEDCGLDLVPEQSSEQSQGTSGKVSSWRI